ncbi:MAG: hypothetical protein WBF17_06045, partial [Phycisphaerae bacterium]
LPDAEPRASGGRAGHGGRPATGRPLGSRAFVEKRQALLGRTLLPQKRGAKPKRKRKRNQV